MIAWLLLVCGILVTVRLPRSAARPRAALLAQRDDPPHPPASLRPLRYGAWALLALAALLATGCGAGAGALSAQPRDPGSASARPAASPAARAVSTGHAPAAAGHAARPEARQLITVTAAAYGDTYAVLNAYRRTGHGWQRVFGPWTARLGRNGFAPPGGKREGDGRTPSGSFSILFFFGAGPNPGFRFRYRQVRPYDFWDDDPASPGYNEWVDSRDASPGRNPEPMDVSAYYDGMVIGYNTARTPGLGSAIFLHLNIGIATAGCVTLPPGELLPLLRWLDAARSPRIQMGVR
jgi:L,D-peptidoglycan transpeptidase YkuD (ErfK/YbiS/YcfS/YnhG family)